MLDKRLSLYKSYQQNPKFPSIAEMEKLGGDTVSWDITIYPTGKFDFRSSPPSTNRRDMLAAIEKWANMTYNDRIMFLSNYNPRLAYAKLLYSMDTFTSKLTTNVRFADESSRVAEYLFNVSIACEISSYMTSVGDNIVEEGVPRDKEITMQTLDMFQYFFSKDEFEEILNKFQGKKTNSLIFYTYIFTFLHAIFAY